MRRTVPLDAGNFDLAWTFFGYADDPPEMRQRRLRQANLMGPAGLVSLDDSEAMLLSQAGIDGNDDENCLVEMGGRGVTNELHGDGQLRSAPSPPALPVPSTRLRPASDCRGPRAGCRIRPAGAPGRPLLCL